VFAVLKALVLLGGVVLSQVQAGASASDRLSAASEPSADWELAAKVRRLVRQLDAPQLREREKAEAELLSLGAAVLDLLPKEFDPTKPEIEQRVGRIRQKLQHLASTASLEASMVTLQGKLPLSKVLAAIQEQTGNALLDARKEVVPEPPDPVLEIAFAKTPFWKALDAVLDQARLGVYPYGDERAIKVLPLLRPQPARAPRAAYSGPFRFEATRVLAQRDLRLGTGALRVELEIAWEPRLAPITLQQKMSEVRAFDETGKPLPVQIEDADREIPVEPDRIAKEIAIFLELPPRAVKQIARLQGTLHALVPGKIETFRFGDLAQAKNVEKRVAGATVTLEGVRKNKKIWEVSTRVRFDEASGALASHRTWISANPAYLEDKSGKHIQGNAETTKQTANEVGVLYLFYVEDPIENYSFVYQTPGMIFSVPFEYDLRAIELP
jgi:hypothetical protein